MKLIFYISGHGYGHAVRDIEIVKSLLTLQPNTEIHFRTAAPKWLFEPLLRDRIVYHERELDFGVKQNNSFSADVQATYDGYAALLDQQENLIDEEVQFLSGVQPDVILSDITPFAFDAAANYGLSAIGIGNFSWDWIYSGFLNDMPQFERIINDIKNSYAKADRLWRIPFYGDMSAFRNIENVPLIGRRATMPRSAVRRHLGIPDSTDSKYVLLGLRAADLAGVEWKTVESMKNMTFVAVSRDITLKNCIHLKEGDMPFEDVLNACDAVLSKPGYSMVSEVIVNQTPMVYVPRNDFLEDEELIRGLQEYAVCEELSQHDFFAGNWHGAFDRLFAKELHWNTIRTDGAPVIAQKICSITNLEYINGVDV